MPITINGTTGVAGVDGSATTPAVQGGDTNTGMFFPAADTIAFAEGGVESMRIDSSGNLVIGNTTALAKLDVGAVSATDEGGEIRLRGASNGTLDHYIDVFQSALRFVRVDKGTQATNAAVNFQIGTAGQWGIAGAGYGTSGQVFTSGGSGAAPTWSAKGLTLLGTVSTTSGTNPTLSGLTLTGYRQLQLVFEGVSHNSTGNNRQILVGTSTADDVNVTGAFGDTATVRGFIFIDLSSGTFCSDVANAGTTASNGSNVLAGDLAITTASTTVSFALDNTGSFDAGQILVYGVN